MRCHHEASQPIHRNWIANPFSCTKNKYSRGLSLRWDLRKHDIAGPIGLKYVRFVGLWGWNQEIMLRSAGTDTHGLGVLGEKTVPSGEDQGNRKPAGFVEHLVVKIQMLSWSLFNPNLMGVQSLVWFSSKTSRIFQVPSSWICCTAPKGQVIGISSGM